MAIDSARLRQWIAARRFEDVARQLPEASADDLAAVPTEELLVYLQSLSDAARRRLPDGLTRELRSRRPTERETAFQLASWLLSAGLAADAELVIDALLVATEDKDAAAWEWIHYLLSLGAAVEARAQLAASPARHLSALRIALAAAHIDLDEGKFDAAAARLAPIVRRHPELTGARATLDRARTCRAIIARFAVARQAPRWSPDYAVFAVNLDEQAERFATLQAQIPDGPPVLFRIPGVKGRYLPDVAASRLADRPALLRKGTLGCFLAHVAAWERFRSSAFDHGLFVEDDARIAIALPPTTAALDLPPGYDLCFANYGMEPTVLHGMGGVLRVVPVAASVASNMPDLATPGGYGYFLSRPGVEKLLGRVARDGFVGDLDWRLLAYTLSTADCEGLPADSFAAKSLRRHRAFIQAAAPIVGYCLLPALLLPRRGRSIRMADNILR